MTGGALLDRIAEAGAAASLDPDGRVRIAGASRLPAELLDLLRQNRVAVAEALATSRAAIVDRPCRPKPHRPPVALEHAPSPSARPHGRTRRMCRRPALYFAAPSAV